MTSICAACLHSEDRHSYSDPMGHTEPYPCSFYLVSKMRACGCAEFVPVEEVI